MSRYWLDSDVLVWAKDNIAPFGYTEYAGFWSLIERNIANGTIKITKQNFKEITEGRKGDDELAKWLRLQLTKWPSVRVSPSKSVQEFASKIGAYVYSESRFYARHRTRFSSGADAWLIAQAAIDNGTVVTREESAPLSHEPKIPDLCTHFEVKIITLTDLMKTLGTTKK
ncbi:MAG TPA: DUF4411 family protein [Acidobacteriaceae bacterium]|nr:DUF4411 family protein [Acidobacteriaceae bacterium]